MLVPKKVEIIKNNGMGYYNQFVGQTANVVTYHADLDEYEVDIPSEGDVSPVTAWSEDEVAVIEWEEDERDAEIETVTIGQAEYDELLEFKKLWDEKWVYEHMYKGKEVEDIK